MTVDLGTFIGHDQSGWIQGYARYIEGFTDVLYEDNLKKNQSMSDYLCGKNEELDNLVNGGDLSNSKDLPFAANLGAESLEVLSMGTLPLVEGFAGYDFLRREKLDDLEPVEYTTEGTISLLTLAGGVLAAEGTNIGKSLICGVTADLAQEVAGESSGYIVKELSGNDVAAFAAETVTRLVAGGIVDAKMSKWSTEFDSKTLQTGYGKLSGDLTETSYGKSSGKNILTYDISKLQRTQPYIDSTEVSALKELIQKDGIEAVNPILVRVENGTAYVVDGHHRLQAFQELGVDRVPVHYVHSNELGKMGVHGYLRTIDEMIEGARLCQ